MVLFTIEPCDYKARIYNTVYDLNKYEQGVRLCQ